MYLYDYSGFGGYTQLDSWTGNGSNGEVINLEVEGSALTADIDGTERLSATDSTHTNGAAGIYSYLDTTSGSHLDNWEGGDVGAAPPAGPKVGSLATLGLGR